MDTGHSGGMLHAGGTVKLATQLLLADLGGEVTAVSLRFAALPVFAGLPQTAQQPLLKPHPKINE